MFLFGGLFRPGGWYDELVKAPWTPPDLAFPIAWSILYILIAIAGYVLAKNKATSLLKLWWAQLVFNGAWSWMFFGEHWTLLALVDLAIILALVGLLVWKSFARGLRSVGLLLLPYVVWLSLALSLNAYVAAYN